MNIRENLNDLYWKKNLTLKEIAKQLNVSYSTLRRLMNKFNIKRRSISEAKLKGKHKPTKEELDDLYSNNKVDSKEIANKFKVGQTTILRWLKEFNIKKRNNSEAKLKGKYKPTKKELYDLYWKKGLSTVKIGGKYGVGSRTVWRWLKKQRIELRKLGVAQSNLRLLSKEKLKNLYITKRLSTIKISKIYGLEGDSVWRLLKHYNIKRRDNFGENNGSWAGGHGYEPYSSEFNKKLKKQILKRDNYICQRCNDKTLKDNKKRQHKRSLEIHHIDYNKFNNGEKNLIVLCNQCNMDANRNRKHWTKFFKKKGRNLLDIK